MKTIFFFTFLLLVLVLPLSQALGQGLVPCGGEGQDSCKLCHLFVLLDNIIDFVLFTIVPVLAIFMIVIGGFLFLTSSGDPQNIQRGRDILRTTVLGLVLIFVAWLIVNLLFTLIGVADWTGLQEGWFSIECSV